MLQLLKSLFKRKKKQLPTVGTCFISNGKYYKTFPSKTTIKDMIMMTDTTCQKKPIWKDEFLNKYGDYTIIEREAFDKQADEFIKEQIILLSEDESEVKLLITRLKQCCSEWFEENYSKTNTLK